MIQERKGNLLQSLLNAFRKTGKHGNPETQDPSLLESKRRIEQRIEDALGEVANSVTDEAVNAA